MVAVLAIRCRNLDLNSQAMQGRFASENYTAKDAMDTEVSY